MKRRNFILSCIAGVGSIALAPLKSWALEKKEIVALDDTTAKALGYAHDATKVDIVKFPKRAGEAGKTQFCNNCSFAQGEPQVIEGKEGKWMGCTLFPNKVVAEKGWCNTWTAKPAK